MMIILLKLKGMQVYSIKSKLIVDEFYLNNNILSKLYIFSISLWIQIQLCRYI